MTFIRIILLSIFTIITACTETNADNSWHGEYHYVASGGETVGGSQIRMNITLKIFNQDGSEKCLLNADGYQTYDRIICKATIDNNKLTVQFKSYEDGKTVNEIGVERYKVGESLFSLENTTDKNVMNKNHYLVNWISYSPFGDKRNNEKDYFDKK